ncbi:hypothetical protein SDC9_83078 [bioreactor metagenome]|uniref:Uncharacterized protein n=1 Tax=bioreactor metagenome TaxID=1076179 RepID=A0A644Z6M1_9ZZZZ
MFLKKAFPIVQISRFPEKIKTKNKRKHKKHHIKTEYVQARLEDFVLGERFCYDGKLLELVETKEAEYIFSIVGSKKELTLKKRWIASHLKAIAHVVYENMEEVKDHGEKEQ